MKRVSFFLAAVALVGCGDGEPCVPGSEGCACNEGQCLTDLQCASNVCVDTGGSGGTAGTGGNGGSGGMGMGGTGGTGELTVGDVVNGLCGILVTDCQVLPGVSELECVTDRAQCVNQSFSESQAVSWARDVVDCVNNNETCSDFITCWQNDVPIC